MYLSKLFITCVALMVASLCCVTPINAQNLRPIIGILSQPTDGDMAALGDQYIAASYVKFIESAGARVVPILYDMSQDDLKTLLSQLNGVLFPGGGVDLANSPTYYDNLKLIWSFVIESNDNGNPFPLWGTCMGFQELCMLAADNLNILSPFDSENYTIPLNLTAAAQTSRLFSLASPAVMTALTTLPITMNAHQYGVSPATYTATASLNTFFDVLSTNGDREGKVFLSTIEAKNYPIYGSQWHPEKPIFEWWAEEVMNHSYDSIVGNQYTAMFFVNQARNNNNKFTTVTAESQALIYNYNPIYSFDIDQDFEQAYYFNNASTSSFTF
ncbi:hypothetical protein SAMD00019534_017080, partial [Acytostelium subglobosum LB1]|uniref:hypothetical protein n=1 Tax=Acytostelium subglobosum LB1 TaxID=1410327 RepID=UPI0006449737